MPLPIRSTAHDPEPERRREPRIPRHHRSGSVGSGRNPKPTRKRRMACEPDGVLASPPVESAGSSETAGTESAAATSASGPSPTAPSKTTTILALLRSEDGATLNEMIAATGWLPHTTRAVLTGLRKKGHVIERGERDDVTIWRIAGEA